MYGQACVLCMNTFHGTKNEEIPKFKPTTTEPFLGRRPLKLGSREGFSSGTIQTATYHERANRPVLMS